MDPKTTTGTYMGNSLFIDTGAFIARINAGDQHHAEAVEAWESLRMSNLGLFSSEPVLIESANFISREQGCRFAARWARRHLESEEIRWLQPGREDFEAAADNLEKYSDQRLSFTDAVSFALMRRHGIRRVFGFDRHFAMAGFELWSPPA